MNTAEWDDRDRLRTTMSFRAYLEARHHLSDEGREVLAITSDAEHYIDMSTGEVFMESGALDGLRKDDRMTILRYIARERLLEDDG